MRHCLLNRTLINHLGYIVAAIYRRSSILLPVGGGHVAPHLLLLVVLHVPNPLVPRVHPLHGPNQPVASMGRRGVRHAAGVKGRSMGGRRSLIHVSVRHIMLVVLCSGAGTTHCVRGVKVSTIAII